MAQERITRVRSPGDPGYSNSWWTRYRQRAEAAGFSDTALEVVGLDAEYILARGILGAGPPSATDHWPETRLRKGLVIGSVQSGKTASMLAVASKCLDAGVDVVVLLTGTSIALWRQTLDRILLQLDGWSPATEAECSRDRVFIPPARLVWGTRGSVPLDNLYQANGARVRHVLAQGKPLLAVAMKNSDHLMRLGKILHQSLRLAIERLQRPIHMVVIDDEADDGSILDAEVERGLGVDSEHLKQLPRHIAGLWSEHSGQRSTFHERLYATYVAYTATPQANLLQADHNPLSPRDFIVALRTPGKEGSVQPPRSTTFEEPEGPRAYYTGGEVFYRSLKEEPVGLYQVLSEPMRQDVTSNAESYAERERAYLSQLGDSLRAFFVAAAMRLYHDGRSVSEARAMGPSPRKAISEKSPPPSCMLVNPASQIDIQLDIARTIAAWSAADGDLGQFAPEQYPSDLQGRAILDPDGLSARLESEAHDWRRWFETYELARQSVLKVYPAAGFKPNTDDLWIEVERILRCDVFPNTRLAVINSNPLADDRPHFAPVRVDESLFEASPDLLSIFVSGNVMARGVTLAGLLTTLFLRDARSPAADTQMQMQRWFGYRGSHLYWCRVFLYQDQFDLFLNYHENDEALKAEVLQQMNRLESEAPKPMVLQGARFKATGKIANLRALPLCPGRQPFVRVIAEERFREHNSDLLTSILDGGEWVDLMAGSTKRGVIRTEPADLLTVAEWLDGFRYEVHDPDPEGRNHRRWQAHATALDLSGKLVPLFRPPGLSASPMESVPPTSCPYSIAAYLRLWHALLTRPARGFFPTDDCRTPWSNINLASYASTAPSFYVGVRFGGDEAGEASHAGLSRHGIRRVIRHHEGWRVLATWGSRNPADMEGAYLGDHLFDYHFHNRALAPDSVAEGWRPRGEPGLLLFHVIKTNDGSESVAPALAIPLGGPDHFAAIAPHHSKTVVA